MRRTRVTALLMLFGTTALIAASGALAASPKRHPAGGPLPFTGIDLNLVVAAALGLVLVGVALRRFARQRS